MERIYRAYKLIEDGDDPRAIDDDGTCDCIFYRQYQLPCKRLWQHELLYRTITVEKWDIYAFMFEDCGMEVYESADKVYITRDIYAEVGAPARQKLEVREVLEQLRSAYYALEEGVEALDPDVADNVVNYWINGLTVATGDLIRTGAAELLASEPKLSSKIDISIFQST